MIYDETRSVQHRKQTDSRKEDLFLFLSLLVSVYNQSVSDVNLGNVTNRKGQ